LFGVASLLLVAVFADVAPGAADAKRAVDPGVRQTVKSGTAKVLVDLRISMLKPEGELKPESVKAQRQAIAEGQDRVLSQLANRADGATPPASAPRTDTPRPPSSPAR